MDKSLCLSRASLLLQQGGRAVLSLFLVSHLGRTLSVPDLGFFTLAMGVLAVVHLLMDMGTGTLAVTLIARHPEREGAMVALLLKFRWQVARGLAIPLFLFGYLETDLEKRLVWWCLVPVCASLSQGAFAPALISRRLFLRPALQSLACQAGALLLTLAVPASRLTGGVATLILWGREVVQAIWIRVLARGSGVPAPQPAPADVRAAFLRSALPMGALTLLQSLYFHSDVFMMRALLGEASLGAYGAALRPLSPLAFLPGAFLLPLLPTWSRRAETGDHGAIQSEMLSALRTLGAGAAALLVIALPLANPILRGLYGVTYAEGPWEATGAFRVLAISYTGIFMGAASHTVLLALGRARALLSLALVALVLNAVGNAVLMPRYGFEAAAWTTAATEWLVNGTAIWWSLRLLKRQGKVGEPETRPLWERVE